MSIAFDRHLKLFSMDKFNLLILSDNIDKLLSYIPNKAFINAAIKMHMKYGFCYELDLICRDLKISMDEFLEEAKKTYFLVEVDNYKRLYAHKPSNIISIENEMRLYESAKPFEETAAAKTIMTKREFLNSKYFHYLYQYCDRFHDGYDIITSCMKLTDHSRTLSVWYDECAKIIRNDIKNGITK